MEADGAEPHQRGGRGSCGIRHVLGRLLVNGVPATIEVPTATFALEPTEGMMTAAIEQQEQTDHEHIFGNAQADVVDDVVKHSLPARSTRPPSSITR